MGHSISAIITKDPIDFKIAHSYDLPVFQEKEYYIIALDDSHSDYWAEKLNIDYNCTNEIILDNSATHFFCKELKLNHYAIINTDYFGGYGSQKANVYKDGERILSLVYINEALRNLGVVSEKDKDEFNSLNLGRYRDFDGYFEKYSEQH